ncbi:MAG: hypothetical protein JXO22_14660 [Phycisphaerae bacterium]|nr:hypothetical protein [Phycisphaerae bacterium]
MARNCVSVRRILLSFVAVGLATTSASGDVVHLQEDFEDGDLTRNPAWLLENPLDWTVQADPTDASNLVAKGVQHLGRSSYLRLNLQASIPWEAVSLQADFLLTDAAEFGMDLDLNIQNSSQIASTRLGTQSGIVLRTPAESGVAHAISGDGWSLSAFEWYRFVLRYDQERRQFITTISHRDTSQVVGQLAYTPPTAIETIPEINHIDVGVGMAAEGTVAYVDNILLRTLSPFALTDVDEDGDVDLADFAVMQRSFTGPS